MLVTWSLQAESLSSDVSTSLGLDLVGPSALTGQGSSAHCTRLIYMGGSVLVAGCARIVYLLIGTYYFADFLGMAPVPSARARSVSFPALACD